MTVASERAPMAMAFSAFAATSLLMPIAIPLVAPASTSLVLPSATALAASAAKRDRTGGHRSARVTDGHGTCRIELIAVIRADIGQNADRHRVPIERFGAVAEGLRIQTRRRGVGAAGEPAIDIRTIASGVGGGVSIDIGIGIAVIIGVEQTIESVRRFGRHYQRRGDQQ